MRQLTFIAFRVDYEFAYGLFILCAFSFLFRSCFDPISYITLGRHECGNGHALQLRSGSTAQPNNKLNINKRGPTGHVVKKERANGVDGGTVDYVGTGVSQDADHAVRHVPALVRHVVGLTVTRLDERRQTHRLVRQVLTAEHLRHHFPVEALHHGAYEQPHILKTLVGPQNEQECHLFRFGAAYRAVSKDAV